MKTKDEIKWKSGMVLPGPCMMHGCDYPARWFVRIKRNGLRLNLLLCDECAEIGEETLVKTFTEGRKCKI